jgi:hypothetical protein
VNSAGIPDRAKVVAPPYDVISAREGESPHARSPYNAQISTAAEYAATPSPLRRFRTTGA